MASKYTLFDFLDGTPLGDDIGNFLGRSTFQSFFPFLDIKYRFDEFSAFLASTFADRTNQQFVAPLNSLLNRVPDGFPSLQAPLSYEAYGNLAGLYGNSSNDTDHNTADHQLPPGVSHISSPYSSDGLVRPGQLPLVDEQPELVVDEDYVVSGRLPDAEGNNGNLVFTQMTIKYILIQSQQYLTLQLSTEDTDYDI